MAPFDAGGRAAGDRIAELAVEAFVRSFIQDLRFGARLLARTPGHTALTVLVLALGVTATTTVLSWMNATMLDPVPGASRTSGLVSVLRGEYTTSPLPPLSYPDLTDLGRSQSAVVDLVGYHDGTVFFTGERIPRRGYAAVVSSTYFDVLGAAPVLGRGFLPSEERVPDGAPVAVISDDAWRERHGANPKVVGRTVEVNRRVYTIVGVAPPRFMGAKTGVRAEIWMPISMDRAVFGGDRLARRDVSWLNVFGRLAPGVSIESASGAMNAAMRGLAAQFPGEHQGRNDVTLDPLWRSPFGANGYLAASLPILLGIACVVLLLASANVANLLLVRSITRRREMAIRSSIGATRGRLARQLLAESLIVGLAGGIVAAILTAWTAETMASFIPPSNIPLAINGRFDLRVLAATLAISLVTCVVCGVAPALRVSGTGPADALKEETGGVASSPHRSRVLSALVVAQVALSAVLLVCAGLLVQSLRNAERTSPGFDPSRIVIASVELGAAGYTREQGHELQKRLTRALAALPDVEAVTAADWVPLTFSKQTELVAPEGYVPHLHEDMDVRSAFVGPGYLDVMRIRKAAGRDFTEHDIDGQPRVCMVDRTFAERYWPGQDALGRRIRARSGNWYTVVGVSEVTRHQRLHEADEPIVYFPLLQTSRGEVTMHVRAKGDPQRLVPVVERTIRAADPRLPVFHLATMEQRVRMGTLFERLAGTFVGILGMVALALAAVGMYGVLAYSTRQRTREVGVRLALGASPSQVFGMVLQRGLALAGAGLVVGLAAAAATTGVLRRVLVGVEATDAITFAAVALTLVAVAAAACALPAWRASRVQPLQALRHE
jgi:predicted permease